MQQNVKIDNFEALKGKLRPLLKRYLEEQGVEVKDSGLFKCINPEHNDRNPSCGLVPESNGTIFNCFSCGAKGDILQAAHLLEGKPIFGPEFITENLVYLAEKYAIPFNTVELTPEELLTIRTYKAYDDAADIISEWQPIEYIKQRNWPVSLCRELKIGSVKSYAEFVTKMHNRGYDRQFLEEIDLTSRIFNENMLVFAVRDEKGRTVGFSSRDMTHSKESKRAKFINTSSKCEIYNKSVTLYGMDIGRHHTPPLYIFEGYPDYVTAYKHGIKNVCAIGGTALTRDHIDLIKSLSISDIILALDGDEAGQNRTEGLLDQYFGGDETIRIRILKISNTTGESDPDEYIEKYGAEAFRALPTLTPFQWRLERFNYDDKPEYICDTMIPFIINDPNEVHREMMAKELSDKTGVRLRTVLKQVDKMINAEEAQKDGVVQTKIRQLINELQTNRTDPATLLEEAADELRQISSEKQEEKNSSNEVITSIDSIREVFETRKPGLQGWRTGYEAFDASISGIPKTDAMITFAGDSNLGKCLKFDTEILLSDGSYDTIENVVKEKKSGIVTMAGHCLIESSVSNWIDSGNLECYRVRTKSGLVTEPSHTHPYYTISGWKKVSDLVEGDKIAVASRYRCFDNIDNHLSLDDAEFLGYILSDGGITRSVTFTNTDDEIISRFYRVVYSLFPGTQIRKEDITYHVTDKGSSSNRAIDWLRDLGLIGLNSHEKFIPDCIFQSSNEKVAQFLGAFYACDGWASRSETDRMEIGVSLCNRRMVMQIRSLLLRFGIKASVKDGFSYCNGKRFDRYTIVITDYSNILRFNEAINIPLQRKSYIIEEYLLTNVSPRGAYSDSFPSELWEYIWDIVDGSGMSHSDFIKAVFPEFVCEYYCNNRKKTRSRVYVPRRETNISRSELLRMANFLKDDFLVSIANGDIYFDEIISIDKIGKHKCYDLTVPGTHNFIANDTVVHNTGFMFELALRIAKLNENVMVLFMSIDDSRAQAISRLVALEAGLKIKQVSHPSQNIKTDEDKAKLEKGWKNIRKLIETGRFSIKDNSHGSTLDFAEGWIRWAKENHPEKEICFFLDNFHKLDDERSKDERVRFKHASSRIHSLKNKLGITAICSMELRKFIDGSNKRPSLQDISESKQMEYDNNLVGMVYSELHYLRDEAKVFWQDCSSGVEVRKPIFEVDIQKNKVSDFKGCLYYKFSPEHSRFSECSGEEVSEWKNEYTKALKKVRDKKFPEEGINPFVESI